MFSVLPSFDLLRRTLVFSAVFCSVKYGENQSFFLMCNSFLDFISMLNNKFFMPPPLQSEQTERGIRGGSHCSTVKTHDEASLHSRLWAAVFLHSLSHWGPSLTVVSDYKAESCRAAPSDRPQRSTSLTSLFVYINVAWYRSAVVVSKHCWSWRS